MFKPLIRKLGRYYHPDIRQVSKPQTVQLLKHLMSRYQTKDLVNESPREFRQSIERLLGTVNWEVEGFKSPERQRDLSVKFHWGHDHDFGEFFVKGRMGERHINILDAFISEFRALPSCLTGLRILDIGCWTGGASLLLCAMGANVVAIDEVKKYIDALKYLKHAFNIQNLEVLNLSLFDCIERRDFDDVFDYVLFAGVLYHVTDPLIALRTTFNCLKDGGTLLLETAAIDSTQPILRYEGPRIFCEGNAQDLSRSGWNWFIPSPVTLSHMMEDVGYSDIRVSKVSKARVLAVAKRKAHIDIMRGGISRRTIR
ncbi:MAG TPA: DUF1698 domain-containing protein [Candidatus Eisenbacteria bacterium]|nr:DUF1698 domain-containing protein [Candidatus Eisenbacteria bacterium]